MPVGSLSVRSPPAVATDDRWQDIRAASFDHDDTTRCKLDGTRWGVHPDEQALATTMAHSAIMEGDNIDYVESLTLKVTVFLNGSFEKCGVGSCALGLHRSSTCVSLVAGI